MHVAVTGMEDIGHREPRLARELRDAVQHGGQLATRNGAIHAVVVRRHATHGGEGILAPGPEARALGLILCLADLGGAGALQHLTDSRAVIHDIGFGAVQFAEQDGGGIDRIARVDEVLGGADRQVVHHLEPAGDDAAGDDVAHRAAGLVDIGEARHQHLGGLGPGQQAHRDFRDHPQHAFGAGHQRQHVQPGRVEAVGADRHRLAFDGQHLELEQVVNGQAVLEAVHATGILGHVAADGAGDLRGGVRRVVEPEGRGGLGNGEIAHPGLQACGAGVGVDLENPRHARHHQQHALRQRQGTAG